MMLLCVYKSKFHGAFACATAWRCRFLTARRSLHGRIRHSTHWLICAQVIICSPNTRLGGESLLVHQELRFHRLIVDESHATRGATERFLSENALVDPPPPGNTYSRRTFTPRFDSCWLVTGTPFTTGLGQMKTGAAALGCWTGKLSAFDGRTQRPKTFAAAADALRALMIRHTKDQVINGGRALSLPKLDARTVRIDLPQAARAGYEQLRASCADKVRRRVGTVLCGNQVSGAPRHRRVISHRHGQAIAARHGPGES